MTAMVAPKGRDSADSTNEGQHHNADKRSKTSSTATEECRKDLYKNNDRCGRMAHKTGPEKANRSHMR